MNAGEEGATNGVDFHCKEESPSFDEGVETKKDEGPDVALRKNILYGTGADAVCEFQNEESFRVNKSFLAYHSTVFNMEFFGESPTTTVKIEDFDRETFQTFLDCLFDLKECTDLDALLIYPIADKYNVKKLLKICTEVLLPIEMTENVCLTLNLATFYKDKVLENEVITFLRHKVGFFNLLENDSYRTLLEPLAIVRIIEVAGMNSIMWKMVYQWGESYLKKHNKSRSTIRLLFEENDILSELFLMDFESASSILDFHDFSNKKLLDSDRILNFLKSNVIENKYLPDKSLWVKVKNGDKIVEIIKFERSFRISSDKAKNGITLFVSSNSFYWKEFKSVDCSVRYFHKKSGSGTANSYSYSPYLILVSDALTDFVEDYQTDFWCDFPIDRDINELAISQVEITYNFFCDCTILTTSLKNRNLRGSQVCFTSNVMCRVNKDAGI